MATLVDRSDRDNCIFEQNSQSCQLQIYMSLHKKLRIQVEGQLKRYSQ